MIYFLIAWMSWAPFLMPSSMAAQTPQAPAADLQAVVETSAGTFVLQFHAEQAPRHVARFIELAREGFYDGTIFHHVLAHGIIQGGDPLTRDPAERERYGTGGLNLGLPREASGLPFVRGTVAATTIPGDPDSAGSQFFICVGDQPQLEGQYTAFAYVAEGIEVVERISNAPADADGYPAERIEIRRIEVRPIPPVPFTTESIEELSGYAVAMETSLGTVVMEMLPDLAPNHVRHFLRLTAAGVFDGTAVHRVAPGFVIQAGDLNTRKEPLPQAAARYVGRIHAEISDAKHTAGIVSMARFEAIDSAETSFFIVLDDQPALDDYYTIFGRVLEGMDVVERIAAVAAENERPLEPVDVHAMLVVRRN